jgi:hypothetical protein
MRTTMDAGGINEALLKQLQPSQQRQLNALSQLLGVKSGLEFSAQIQNIAPISGDARTQLLQAAKAELALLNPKSNVPAIQKQIQAINERIQLLQSPDLKLLELQAVSVKTGAGAVNLLAYTSNTYARNAPANGIGHSINTPLVIGATVLLTLDAEQQLVAINPTTTANSSKDVISQALRALLPQKDQGLDLLSKLPQVLQTLEKLPPAARAQWLSTELQSALQQLGRQLPSAVELSNPGKLAQHIKLSGINFEQSLATALGKASAPSSGNSTGAANALGQVATTSGATPSATKALGDNIKNALAQELKNSPAPSNPSPKVKIPTDITPSLGIKGTANSNNSVQQPSQLSRSVNAPRLLTAALSPPKHKHSNLINNPDKPALKDMKGALLGLRQTLTRELAQATSQVPAQSTPPGSPLTQTPSQQLMLLLGQMGNHHLPELSQKVLRAQLVMLLQQQTFGSLVKIQLQQLHSLNHQQSQADQPQASQSWQVEIPLRQGTEVYPLQLQFERHWLEEKDAANSAKPGSGKQRQWNLMLKFDLPKLGQFCAQLTLVGSQLSATLWAERESTLANTRNLSASLKSQLEQQGLEVTQLQCLKGSPNQPKMTLSYSLVDIKT